MKRWVLLTLLLYFISLSVLTVPLFLAVFDIGKDLLPVFYVWFVPVLVLVQGVLLLVPIAVIHERPIKRRKVVFSAVFGAIPMAALALGFFGSMALMILREDAVVKYLYGYPARIVLVISWMVWGVVFYKSFSIEDPKAFTTHLTRWLLRGSILELLVAVPSHVISRHRDECCAPPFTLLGIATGLSIALMSFGPGVFFLFAQKMRAKKGKQHNKAMNSKPF